MFPRIQKTIADKLIKPYLLRYLKKARTTKMKGFDLIIEPTVFHPKFFFSSIYFFEFIEKLSLNGNSFLEVGCGSGLLSLLARRQGAKVTCVDVNDIAVANTKKNLEKNFETGKGNFICLLSDVFNSVPTQKFDCIVINPPYFFKDSFERNDLAWNCGKNGEYFIKLFSQLNKYINETTKVYMVLADNCDIEKIEEIANEFKFELKLVEEKKIRWEVNFIFEISPSIS